MKILIVGDWQFSIYEQAFEGGFSNLGHIVYKFGVTDYFSDSTESKIQNKISYGPRITKINKALVNYLFNIQPDLIFLNRVRHISVDTIKYIKSNTNSKIFSYNNDDPFSEEYPFYFWWRYKSILKFCDHIFVYRKKNISELKKMGINHFSILKSYYIKDKNFYFDKIINNKFKSDLLFIGHFENDGRDEVIKFLLDNKINIKLFGPEWHRSKYYSIFKKHMGHDIKSLFDKDYNLALNSAKIALVFLSKKNNDTYTRRCFEIPATKTMMIAEYTDDLNSMFKEGKEVEYFRDKEELLKKIQYYLMNEQKIKEIGENGYLRLVRDGHDIIDRCKEVLSVYNEK